ncbi:hypothetical protein [Ramlibacter rhizophilus]|uniref:Uncharacterized protein n=1 Tax=Ramlibacter rhizophilus TaxID=1781167 RepID=A0A4Z0BXG4_9BURK|nr:hypothetical protein [Ramlibacter rhizophilus]TFZ03392.1 hypothetical protein EZ242_05785 [Ramlibacter rhizophilus]
MNDKANPGLVVFDMPQFDRFQATQAPKLLEVVSPPYLVATRMGYAPMLDVELPGGVRYTLLISSASLTAGLEKLRVANRGQLNNIRFWISRESPDPKSKYMILPAT